MWSEAWPYAGEGGGSYFFIENFSKRQPDPSLSSLKMQKYRRFYLGRFAPSLAHFLEHSMSMLALPPPPEGKKKSCIYCLGLKPKNKLPTCSRETDHTV